MVRVALCDDQVEYLDFEEKTIKKCFDKNSVECKVCKYKSGQDFLNAEFNQYDIVFLDMDMPDISGIEVAKIMRDGGFKGEIVFVTIMIKLALSGYKVGAYRYIIKKMKQEKQLAFEECINSYIVEKNKREKVIVIQSSEGSVSTYTGRVVYIESEKHYLYFHLYEDNNTKVIKARGKIEDWESMTKYNMIRIHKGIILNLEYVDGIRRYCAELKYNLGRIMIGQPRYNQIYIQYLKYKGGLEIE